MPADARKAWDELLVETVGPIPSIVARNGRSRDFRRLRNELRGTDLSMVSEVIDRVRRERSVVRVSNSDGTITYIGEPIICPDNVIAGVYVGYGPEAPADPPRLAAIHWDSNAPTGVPRLYLESDFLDMVEIPVENRDRSIYGPLDFAAESSERTI